MNIWGERLGRGGRVGGIKLRGRDQLREVSRVEMEGMGDRFGWGVVGG